MQSVGKVVLVLIALVLALVYLIRIIHERHRYGHALRMNKWKLVLTLLIPLFVYFIAFKGNLPHLTHSTQEHDQSVIHADTREHTSPTKEKQDKKEASQEAAQEEVNAIDHDGVTDQDKKLALSQAQTYLGGIGTSQAALYQQLISQYGGGLNPQAARYAVDHVHVDWGQEALKAAQDYQSNQNLNGSSLYAQLVSNVNQFTPQQAQYAVQHV